MAEEVKLPQLGESVTDGVIIEWLVSVGDTVEVDQPLFELSTDKIDTEVPSPVAGVVSEIRAEVDETVEVGQVVAVIDPDGDAGSAGGDTSDDTAQDTETQDAAPEKQPQPEPARTEQPAPAASDTSDAAPAPSTPAPASSGDGAGSKALLSPLVRKLLREADLDPSQVEGTGRGGRITREDAQRAIAEGPTTRAPQPTPAAPAAPAPPPPPAPAAPAAQERPEASPTQVDFGGQREITQDLTRVRKAIANAMHDSLQTTAQLTAAVEADVTAIMNLRAAHKDAFKARHGASLSPLPLIARAACMTIPRHPAINSSIDLDSGTSTFHNYINLGIAVDTERGLLVPNIKDAQDLNVPGLAKQIGDLAKRTRGKGLTPDEITGGTFTITNTGSRGTLFDTPILNPPEVAILATCAIEKRPVVVSDNYGDSIAIRWMTYLCLTYDHRMIDGADAARFLQDLKWVIETHDFQGELGL